MAVAGVLPAEEWEEVEKSGIVVLAEVVVVGHQTVDAPLCLPWAPLQLYTLQRNSVRRRKDM